MNKQKISKYLKTLRERKELSRTEAAKSLGTLYKSILDWESGVMPSNESLLALAELYEVTVDDILECGQQITDEELYAKYPILKPAGYVARTNNKQYIYTSYQTDLININARLKELIHLFRKRTLSRSEDYELRFLFNGMCDFSNYFHKKYNSHQKDKYICFIEVLNDCKNISKSPEEYYFEVRKYVDILNNYEFNHPIPEYGVAEKESFKHKQFNLLEKWEKDIWLASIQNSDLILAPERSANELKYYEEKYGEQFNKEIAVKRVIKYLINNGAELNPWLFSFIERKKKDHNILIELEDIYIDYIKPIFIQFHNPDDVEDDGYKYAYVPNTAKHRYLDNFLTYSFPLSTANRISPNEVLDLLTKATEEEVVEFLYSIRQRYGDLNETEYRFKKATVDYDLLFFYKSKNKLKQDEELADRRIKQVDCLERKLRDGETVYYEYEEEDISNKKDFNHMSLMKMWKNQLTYSQFLKKRDHQKTVELLNEIDQLSLQEIRDKYFGKEVVEIDE